MRSNLRVQNGHVTRFDGLIQAWVLVCIEGAGGGGDPPGPTAEDNALKSAQTEVARQQLEVSKQQLAYSQAVTPMQLAQGGYDLVEAPKQHFNAEGDEFVLQQIGVDENGNPRYGSVPNPAYRPARDEYITDNLQSGEYAVPVGNKTYIVKQQQAYKDLTALSMQTQKAAAERQLKALQGGLDVDPAVEQDLSRGEQQLREELLNRLGPGYETSDPGIRALNEYQRQANSIRFQVRYGELSNAGALTSNAQQQTMRQQQQLMGTLAAGSDPYRVTSELLGQAGQSAGQAYQTGQSERFGAFQLGAASRSSNNQMIGAGMGAAATLAIGGAILV